MSRARPIEIDLRERGTVSGLLTVPGKTSTCYIMAHGAGAGMTHPFMVAVADGLAERGIATLRYQFPYMERGSKRPDRPELAHATVRGAAETVRKAMPGVPLVAGGKSFGGRMTSQAQAEKPRLGVVGLVFFGFPLHPAGKPSDQRAEHLAVVNVPMLFLQGSRDALASMDLLVPLVDRLGDRVTLSVIEDGDHSFHVPVRSGKTDRQVMNEILDVMARWIGGVAS